jgi:hypothetical protein
MTPQPDQQQPAVPPLHCAIIAAAVHESVHGPHAILDIRAATMVHEQSMLAWSVEGRRQIFTSHRVR